MLSEPAFTLVTITIDVAMASVGVVLALAWGASVGLDEAGNEQLWIFVPLVIGWLTVRARYRRQLRIKFLDEVEPLVGAVSLSALTLLTLMLTLGDNARPGALVVRLWLLAVVLLPLGRLARALIQRNARRHRRVSTPALIVGGGHVAQQIARRLHHLPEYGLRPIGLLHHEPPLPQAPDGHLPTLGDPDELAQVARDTGAQHVIIAFSSDPDERFVPLTRTSHDMGMVVSVVPRLFDAVGERVRVEHIGGLPLLSLDRIDPRGWQFAVKHTLDRTLAAVGLIFLSPLLVMLVILVRLSSPGPIFFCQRRVGRDGEPFDVLKFRSMRPPRASDPTFRPSAGAAPGGVEGEDRRTAVGKFMRATSLDELPQLFNVVRGDMSLVGPRPERPEYVELFNEQIRRYGERHRVKAGITGWAQVHGLRGQTSIADRAEWDNHYIENWSLRLDFKILALTMLTLFRRSED